MIKFFDLENFRVTQFGISKTFSKVLSQPSILHKSAQQSNSPFVPRLVIVEPTEPSKSSKVVKGIENISAPEESTKVVLEQARSIVTKTA